MCLHICGEDCESNFTLNTATHSDPSELSIQIGNGNSLRIYISLNPELRDTLVLSKINEIFFER